LGGPTTSASPVALLYAPLFVCGRRSRGACRLDTSSCMVWAGSSTRHPWTTSSGWARLCLGGAGLACLAPVPFLSTLLLTFQYRRADSTSRRDTVSGSVFSDARGDALHLTRFIVTISDTVLTYADNAAASNTTAELPVHFLSAFGELRLRSIADYQARSRERCNLLIAIGRHSGRLWGGTFLYLLRYRLRGRRRTCAWPVRAVSDNRTAEAAHSLLRFNDAIRVYAGAASACTPCGRALLRSPTIPPSHSLPPPLPSSLHLWY